MVNRRLRQLVDILLEAVFPTVCLGCGAGGELLCEKCLAAAPQAEKMCFNCQAASGNGVCPECARRFRLGKARIFWATNYRYEPVRRLIRTLKYRHAASAATILAEMIHARSSDQHRVLVKATAQNTLVIPVPMHAARLRERGENHAALIAEEFAKLANLTFAPDILLKIRPTHSQVEARSRAERLKNLAKSFVVRDAAKITGQNIILVDDVLTTGATIIECVKVLRIAGADRITVLVVAH